MHSRDYRKKGEGTATPTYWRSFAGFGVRTRLMLALAAAGLFTVSASGVAVYSFSSARVALDEVAARHLPAVTTAHYLAQQSRALTSSGPALLAAQDDHERAQAALDVAGQIFMVEELLRSLRRFGTDDGVVDALEMQTRELKETWGGLENRVMASFVLNNEVEASLLRAQRAHETWHKAFSRWRSQNAIDPSWSAFAWTALDLGGEVRQGVALLQGAGEAEDKAELARAREDFALRMGQARLMLARLPDDGTLAAALEGVAEQGTREGNLFDLRHEQLTELAQAQTLLAVYNRYASRLVLEANRLVDARHNVVAEARLSLHERLAGSTSLLSAIVLACMAGLIAIAFLVGRSIAGRLEALQTSMEAHAAGKKAAIPSGGRDEIARMAEALRVFIGIIAEREEQLRAARDELEARVQERTRELVAQMQQREVSELRLRSIMDNAADGIITMDAQGTILTFNPRAESIFGWKAEEVVGSSVARLMPDPHSSNHGNYIGHYLTTGERKILGQEREVEGVTRDGRLLPLDLAVSEVRIGGVHTFIALVRDITARKAVERQLQDAKEHAELANRAKSEFLAMVSHELRTPLNAIIGFSEIMRAELFGPLGSVQYTGYARDINESGQHLLSVINDILDISRVESGKFELYEEEAELSELAEAAARLIRVRCEEKGIALFQDLPPAPVLLRCDPRRIKQVLLNLLSNAVKFTDEGGHVILRLRSETRAVCLEVEDNGIGMAEADIAIALSAFGQVDSRLSRRYEGTGLGLPLVKHLVERHGGALSIRSTLGHGTTVTVSLPLERLLPSPREMRAVST
ncbi:PAS domain S-box protein [Telmatospirillum sp. J64-1]|uniref:PAS domain S-box protein n=1 Tax=Telmatospirillum sp. J64-1 TaxID=2502183 RepID=UPI00115F1C3C|nr:PAS domain S-box protein [Telmatospirillum sp. J64-1]